MTPSGIPTHEKKQYQLFHHSDTDDSGSVPQVVVHNTRNRVVYDFTDHDLIFFPEIICIWNYYILAIG